MLTPVPGSTFTSSSVTFTWSAGSANAYYLFVGSSLHGTDIYNSQTVTVLSKTVTNIPTNGHTIYVTLGSQVNGTWYTNNYTYTASNGTATPTPTPTPTPGSQCAPVTFSASNYIVSMATTTSGATIFYTTDSTTPTHNGTTPTGTTVKYTAPVTVGQCNDAFFNALAYKAGVSDSIVASYNADYSLAQGCHAGGGGGGGGFAMMATESVTATTVIYSVWDGDWAILEEYDNTGARVQGYLQGYHGLVKTLVDNIYYYQDELGSTSHIASATGALLEYYKYNLYGKPTYFSSTSQQLNASTYNVVDLGNGGARWIPQLGLYDDRNRFMSPDLGRFLQPDPIGFKGDASNLYRYCGNDWANRGDPLGLDGDAIGNTLAKPSPYVPPGDLGPGHDFQSELGAWERHMEVNVDAHHVENMQFARVEARPIPSSLPGPVRKALPASNTIGVMGAGGIAARGNQALVRLVNALGGSTVYRNYVATALHQLQAMGYHSAITIGYSRGGVVMINTIGHFQDMSFRVIGIDVARGGTGAISLPRNVTSAVNYYQQNAHDYALGHTGNSFAGTALRSDYVDVQNINLTGNPLVNHSNIVQAVSEGILMGEH